MIKQIPVAEGDDYSIFVNMFPNSCPHSVSLVFESLESIKQFTFLKTKPPADSDVFDLELSPELLDDIAATWIKYRQARQEGGG